MFTRNIVLFAALLLGLSGCLGTEVPYTVSSSTAKPKSATPGATPTPTPTTSPTPAPGGGSLPFGAISVSPTTPSISGWAQDIDNLTVAVTVDLYVNGPMGMGGVLIGNVLANMPRTLFPAGNYGISATVPTAYQDGRVRRLYAYGVDNRSPFTRNPLSGSPFTFVAGTNQVGLDYFNNNVRNSIQTSCGGCHNGTRVGVLGGYVEQKARLMEPSPFVDGTASNNSIYNKARGINHGGGTICAAGAAPCSLLNTWWANEFGPGHIDGF